MDEATGQAGETGGWGKLAAHCWREYILIMRACVKTFGVGLWFLHFLIKIPARQVYVAVSLLLDNVFFPRYRRVRIENPVFLIGHPRSSTTFLHDVLTQTGEFLVFRDWELLNPSLTVRAIAGRSKILRSLLFMLFDLRFTPNKLVAQIRDLFRGTKSRTEFGGPIAGRAEALGFIVGEEEPLFTLVLDSQFVAMATPIGFDERGYPEVTFNDAQPHQEQSCRFFRNCLKRQIHWTKKKQVLAKVNFSLFRVKTLMKVFPDAKFVFVARSPLETIPSHLSLHKWRLTRNFGLENIPPERLQQYYKTRYEYNIAFYKRFEEILASGEIPADRLMLLTYPDLKKDLWGELKRMRDFTGITYSPELEARIKAQSEKQGSYRRKHDNLPLEAFGFSEEQVKADLGPAFARYASF